MGLAAYLRKKVGLITVLALALLAGCGKYKTIGTYTLPGDYRVTIEEKTDWQFEPICYYSISQHGRMIIPRTFRGVESQLYEKLTILDSGQGVMALAPASSPSSVLILFNVQNGESFPYRADRESQEDAQARGDRMLQVLKNNPAHAKADFGD